MFRLADRFVLPCCAVLLPLAAHSSPLSIYLRDYYTEYQVVKECNVRARLSADDAATAKSAITTIEAYYLRRDPAIDKTSLKKQAIRNKNSAFKMVMQTDKVDLREFCLGSLQFSATRAASSPTPRRKKTDPDCSSRLA
jgi:hypothetical protein